jgi:REP element-mobilizing transposase RayT
MPHSLANVLLHIVFSTKNRAPFLQSPKIREEMEAYMVGTLVAIECPSLIVRTVEDHLHCLCELSRTKSIAKLVEELKVESSSWAKKQDSALRDFHWQAGYGAFSVSQSNAADVKTYIANQEQHHRKITYQDELRLLLTRHEIEFDERYVWD